ncbi:MAG TPA: serine--tRNA ligase [Gemmatimonadales bacterium]|nr:serine--tRNA ligase [Gemmatimonadales bacterium]
MLDPKLFRDADSIAAARRRLARRGGSSATLVDALAAAAEQRRGEVTATDQLKAELNAKSRLVGEKKRAGEDVTALLAELAQLSDRVKQAEQSLRAAEQRFEALLLEVPNLPADDCPDGDASANQVVRSWGEPVPQEEWRLPHWEIGRRLGVLDLERGARLTGSGFPVYVGLGARLERSLITWLLDLQARENGYIEVSPPFLVNAETMTGTGQLPKFEDELYAVPRDGLYLIPTAEVPVTNLHRDEILAAERLPLRYCSYTPCFRREAGAHGADTRGILRVHQFDKVELVWFTRPEDSDQALESLTAHAELALQRLGLAYRVVKLAAGDLGFSSHRTYDLEVWAPGVGKWLEVSSCSTFADFQARRMNLRFRRSAGAKPEFVHTLNGSSLGLARVLIALLENGLQPDGSVKLPGVLVPLMGVDRIEPSGA